MAETALVAPDTVDEFSRYRLFDLYKEIRLLMAERHAIEYRLSCLLRELDQREQVDGRPLYLASWLARTFGLGYGAARERVRTRPPHRALVRRRRNETRQPGAAMPAASPPGP